MRMDHEMGVFVEGPIQAHPSTTYSISRFEGAFTVSHVTVCGLDTQLDSRIRTAELGRVDGLAVSVAFLWYIPT